MMRRLLAQNWKLILLVAVMLPILTSLGFWQLGRAEEKRAILAAEAEQTALPPLAVADVNQKLPEFRRIAVLGEYDQQRSWLLENRIHQGRYGFELVTPFRLQNGQLLLVHRGWLAGDSSRQRLPTYLTPSGVVKLIGQIDRNGAEGFELPGAQIEAGWPKRVQWLPIDRATIELKEKLPDFMLRVDRGQPGAYEPVYHAINMPPEKHQAYAAQWFGIALVVLVLFAHRMWRQAKEISKA